MRLILALGFSALLWLAWSQPAGEVRIRFAGTGHPDIVASKPRMQAGIVVDIAGERWLLDAGAGVLARLYDYKVPPETLSHIFLSHLHYDHCLDLGAILLLWQTSGPVPLTTENRRPLHLFGPDGADQMLADLYDKAYGIDGRGRRLLKTPLLQRKRIRDAGVYAGRNYKASFHEVKHANMDCWAIKLETPRGVLVYSGDIGSPLVTKAEDNQEFIDWAKGADMLILDTLHLAPEELARMTAGVKPKTLVLSHLSERVIPLFKYYDLKKTVSLCEKGAAKVVVAEEGMELKL
ncbi:MAG: MBL fold metallo-hydrolase [Acidobacteria bacterium]|nr:MBL fold metallo-hydrolase [Acidobacteriota bacterium]